MRLPKLVLFLSVLMLLLSGLSFAQDSLNVTKVGELFSFWNSVYGMTIGDGFACILDNSIGLRIIDLSDPANLTETGCFTNYMTNTDAVVSGDFVYMTTSGYSSGNNTGLSVIDISDGHGNIQRHMVCTNR